jgi:hypothetical protein
MAESMPFLLSVSLFYFRYISFRSWIIWTWFGVHLASLGNVEFVTYPIPASDFQVTVRAYSFDDFTEYCGWYFLFCFFWTAAFITAVGDTIVSMAVSTWYFTVDHNVNSCTVLQSVLTTSRYHLGTCAYGSLLVAIVQLIQAIITRFQKRVAKFTNQSLAQCLCTFSENFLVEVNRHRKRGVRAIHCHLCRFLKPLFSLCLCSLLLSMLFVLCGKMSQIHQQECLVSMK